MTELLYTVLCVSLVVLLLGLVGGVLWWVGESEGRNGR